MAKSDASKNVLGFKYQEMVALVKCLDAPDGSNIYLECFGDVSDGLSESTEVKHSTVEDKLLYDTHIDFWKTLSNIIEEYETFKFYNKFILHTTAGIKAESIFEDWNNQSADEKANKIFSVTPNETINGYFLNVKSFNQPLLKEVLGKFGIEAGQSPAKEFYKDVLIGHAAILKPLKEEFREPFVVSLLGYISVKLVISNAYRWEINIDEFNENFQAYLKAYQMDELTFLKSDKSGDGVESDNFRFVQELKRIDYSSRIGLAVKDYVRAMDSQMKMIKRRQSLSEEFDSYDEEIMETMVDLKAVHIDQLRTSDESDIDKRSRRFMDDSLSKVQTKTEIVGVKGVRAYYPKGRVHHNVETNSNFTWKLKDDEI